MPQYSCNHYSSSPIKTTYRAVATQLKTQYQRSTAKLGALMGLLPTPTVPNDRSLLGKTVLVTGTTHGIGKELVRKMANCHAERIIMCNHNREEGERIVKMLKGEARNLDCINVYCELKSFASVTKAIKEIKEIAERCGGLDVIVANAGVMCPPWETTEDGFEHQLQVNYLSQFKLILSLLPYVKNEGRIVGVASTYMWCTADIPFIDRQWDKAHFDTYIGYSQSKLALAIFLHELEYRLINTNRRISCVAAYPGEIQTSLYRYMPTLVKYFTYFVGYLMMESPESAAERIMVAVASPSLVPANDFKSLTTPTYQETVKIPSPIYLAENAVGVPHPAIYNTMLREDLWNWSIKAAEIENVDELLSDNKTESDSTLNETFPVR